MKKALIITAVIVALVAIVLINPVIVANRIAEAQGLDFSAQLVLNVFKTLMA